MRAIKSLIHAAIRSVSSFSYYKDVIQSRFVFSLKFFIAVSIFFAFLTSAIIGVSNGASYKRLADRFSLRAPSLFPHDLTIEVKDGLIKTNAEEPLHFPIPYELFTDTPPAVSDQQQTYLITIDSKGSVDDYEKSQSLILITANTIVLPRDNGGYQTLPLSEIGNFKLDKNIYDRFINKTLPFIRILPAVILTAVFGIAFFFFGIIRFLSLIVLSGFLLIAAKIMQVKITYKKILQVSLHSSLLPLLLQITMSAFGLIPPIPFFNSIVFILYNLIILAELKKTQDNKSAVSNS